LTNLYYIEADSGTIHLTDRKSGWDSKSLCGSVRGHATEVHNEWRAHQVIVGDADPPGMNPNLCQRCDRIAKNKHHSAHMALLEMADEHGYKQRQNDQGSHRALERDL